VTALTIGMMTVFVGSNAPYLAEGEEHRGECTGRPNDAGFPTLQSIRC